MNNFLKITALATLTIPAVLLAEDDEFFTPKSTIGGYGELHYNHQKNDGSDATKTLDFHRFVLFYSHAWTPKWTLKSEVEIEHNFVKNGQGELELEQAYIDYHHSDEFGFQVGVVLPSVGLFNEWHEPPLFLSVERPTYNKNIVPTTWFGNGVSIYGSVKSFDYKLTVIEGLDATKFSATSGIRSGRQKGFKSNAEDLLYNFRLNYTGYNGLLLGTSFSYNDATHIDSSSNNSVSLFEIHAKYDANNFVGVFELANINYGEPDLIGGVESAFGYYLDLGYNIGSLMNLDSKVIPFFRWEDYNTAANTKDGGDTEENNHFRTWMFGLSVKPIDQVVFKVDYSVSKNELSEAKTKMFNFGAGYMF